jgi:DNA-binding MarR family transcriptional regulator
MMDDSRAFDGWQRLGRAVMAEVSTDDPAGLRQVREQLGQLSADLNRSLAYLAGAYCPAGCQVHVHYSHGEIARDLGITRQAVSKLVKAARS